MHAYEEFITTILSKLIVLAAGFRLRADTLQGGRV